MQLINQITNMVFRQNMVIRQWGAIKQAAGQIGIYVTFINTLMLGTTLYSTGWVQQNVVTIRYIPFMAILFGVIGLLLLFSWKMDVPSFFASWNDQFWNHGNKMRDYLDDRFDKVDAEMKELREKVDGIDNRTKEN